MSASPTQYIYPSFEDPVSGHAYSKDGSNWTWSAIQPFHGSVCEKPHEPGSAFTSLCGSRERPFLVRAYRHSHTKSASGKHLGVAETETNAMCTYRYLMKNGDQRTSCPRSTRCAKAGTRMRPAKTGRELESACSHLPRVDQTFKPRDLGCTQLHVHSTNSAAGTEKRRFRANGASPDA